MGLSITCIDSLNYTPTIAALKQTVDTLKDKIDIERVYWFSDIDFPFDEKMRILNRVPVTWFKTAKMKNYNEDYAYITLKICPSLCVEDFNLIIHPDGFAVNAEAWTDDFLNYDYIGASWGDGSVGNGGFCLRSRKLYDAFIDMEIKHSTHDYPSFLGSDFYYVITANGEKYIPEDNIICKVHKKILEQQYGIKFAPTEIADRFSIEHNYNPNWFGKSLGFHGKHGIAEHYGVKL